MEVMVPLLVKHMFDVFRNPRTIYISRQPGKLELVIEFYTSFMTSCVLVEWM